MNLMSDDETIVQASLRSSIFSGYKYQTLARIIPNIAVIRLSRGDVLYRSGESAQRLFQVLEGELDLDLNRRHTDVTSRSQFAGTELLIGKTNYNQTVSAHSDAIVLALDSMAIDKLLSENKDFKSRVLFNEPSKKAKPVKGGGLLVNIGWLLTIIAPVGVFLISERSGFHINQSLFLGILTATVSMWMFGLSDIFVPSLFVVLAVIVLGLVPESVALSGFASDGLFMAMSILGLSTLLVSSGLTYRFLLYTLRISPRTQLFYNFNLILSGFLLSTLVPSINGRATLIAPFLKDMNEALKAQPLGRAANLLTISAFTGVSLFSPVFLSSKSVNFVVFGLLPEQMQNAFQWVGWFIAASFTGMVMLFAYAMLVTLFFGNRERLSLSKSLIANQMALLGPLNGREWTAIVAVLMFSVGVFVSPVIHISPPWIAFILFFGILLSGAISSDEFKHDIDWPFLIFMAGVVSMVNSMRHLELDTWMAHKFAWMGDYMVNDFPLFILLLAGALTVVRIVVPISATIVMFAAIFNSIALVEGVNPWVIGFIILVLGENWYAPYQCSYYLQFRDMLRSPPLYDENKFLLFNALMTLVKLGAIYASIPFWKYLGLM